MEEKTNPEELEALIHRELNQLTELQAPETLIPGVMQAIQTRAAKHWWQRPWTSWPRLFQIVSMPVLALNAALIVFLASFVWKAAANMETVPQIQEGFQIVTSIWDVFSALFGAVLILAQGLSQHWILFGASVAAMMYLACIGVGTLFVRIACRNTNVR